MEILVKYHFLRSYWPQS